MFSCYSHFFFSFTIECGKGFRYKVSQRSHKCSGVLERQPGSLIQKLMQNSSILATSTIVSNTTVSNETNTTPTLTNSANISTTCNENQKQSEHETTTHDLCLDDLLKESYEKLMKSNENEIQLLPQIVGDNAFENNTGVMTFDNSMQTNSTNYTTSINNNFNTNYHSTLETICEDSIKELLYGHVG